MAFFAPQFQLASDLHLETPLTKPQYSSFRLSVQAENLFLLGDIGLVVDVGLFQFLTRILEEHRGCRIFYVLGNHEPYQTTYEHAFQMLRDFESDAKHNFGGRFKFLCRDRYDLDENITILGCTLWSAIQDDQKPDIASRSSDLNADRGIRNWTIERHQNEHKKDLMWLNSQVSTIEKDEPHRQIVVATHYSPTIDARANDPQHKGSSVSSNFHTDLSQELCWLSSTVKLWAFGHTHYNCAFRDEETDKLVVANQKGYSGIGAGKRRVVTKVKIVEAGKVWTIIERRKSREEESISLVNAQTKKETVNNIVNKPDEKKPKDAFLVRMEQRIRRLWGLQSKRQQL